VGSLVSVKGGGRLVELEYGGVVLPLVWTN